MKNNQTNKESQNTQQNSLSIFGYQGIKNNSNLQDNEYTHNIHSYINSIKKLPCEFCDKQKCTKNLRKYFYQQINSNMYSKYSSSQNYFYSKDIIDILSMNTNNKSTKVTILYKDYLTYDEDEEYLKRTYKINEYPKKMTLVCEYYKYHKDVCRLFMLPLADLMDKYYDKKRRIEYKQIMEVLSKKGESKQIPAAKNDKDLKPKKTTQLKSFKLLEGIDLRSYQMIDINKPNYQNISLTKTSLNKIKNQLIELINNSGLSSHFDQVSKTIDLKLSEMQESKITEGSFHLKDFEKFINDKTKIDQLSPTIKIIGNKHFLRSSITNYYPKSNIFFKDKNKNNIGKIESTSHQSTQPCSNDFLKSEIVTNPSDKDTHQTFFKIKCQNIPINNEPINNTKQHPLNIKTSRSEAKQNLYFIQPHELKNHNVQQNYVSSPGIKSVSSTSINFYKKSNSQQKYEIDNNIVSNNNNNNINNLDTKQIYSHRTNLNYQHAGLIIEECVSQAKKLNTKHKYTKSESNPLTKIGFLNNQIQNSRPTSIKNLDNLIKSSYITSKNPSITKFDADFQKLNFQNINDELLSLMSIKDKKKSTPDLRQIIPQTMKNSQQVNSSDKKIQNNFFKTEKPNFQLIQQQQQQQQQKFNSNLKVTPQIQSIYNIKTQSTQLSGFQTLKQNQNFKGNLELNLKKTQSPRLSAASSPRTNLILYQFIKKK